MGGGLSHKVLLLSAVSAVSICLVFFLAGCKKEQSPAPLPPPVVTVVVVTPKDVAINVEFVAQTQSSHLVNIQARVSGFLDKRVYTEGQIVKEGQVLFLMDPKPFQAQLNLSYTTITSPVAGVTSAAQQGPKGHFVWLVGKDGRIDLRPVVVGEWHGDDWFIFEGLQAGEQVVVEGTLSLRPDMPVTVKPYQRKTGAVATETKSDTARDGK